MILYHLGKRMPQPRERRPYLTVRYPSMNEPGAFFSPNWKEVLHYHFGMSRSVPRLYVFKCPMSTIKKAGGFHRYDSATEIWIPESLWDTLQFLGKREVGRIEEKRLSRMSLFERGEDSSLKNPKIRAWLKKKALKNCRPKDRKLILGGNNARVNSLDALDARFGYARS